jgi:ferredoxin, 2Fe-2S
MPTVIVTDSTGTVHEVQIDSGTSVMQGLVSEGIDGIIGECGGSAMCATCHVYVDSDQLPLLNPMDAVEAEMLKSTASERLPNSRLSCQLIVSPELEGLRVTLPPSQT